MENKSNHTSISTINEVCGVLALIKGAELWLLANAFGVPLLMIGFAMVYFAVRSKSSDEPFRSFPTVFSVCASVFVGAFQTEYTVELAIVSGYIGFISFAIKLYLEAENAHNKE
ncbi:hypothetical protein [Marinobacter sp. F3R08]|uniref:hypothetical protein n=1 Tax=Marinobacter sp. F3R08 TaxID=2841559 RepID=UPI001C09FB6C|nr:hypothetical protein [Marinobacter sp. F3R08]MBU2952283.1 hypothetical protein [Marinobacter sp. F3R08]